MGFPDAGFWTLAMQHESVLFAGNGVAGRRRVFYSRVI